MFNPIITYDIRLMCYFIDYKEHTYTQGYSFNWDDIYFVIRMFIWNIYYLQLYMLASEPWRFYVIKGSN